MSGTNQSKPVQNQEDMDLKPTNNLNSSISNNEQDVTPINSNINIKTVRDDQEGNLQIQIQEAIAATIRASRKSTPLETQNITSPNSSACSTSQNAPDSECSNSEDQSEVLHNTETDQSCDSNSSTNAVETDVQPQDDINTAPNRRILDTVVENDESNPIKPCEKTVQHPGDISDEKTIQKPSDIEVASSQDTVDSEQENSSRKVPVTSHDKDDNVEGDADDSDSKPTEDTVEETPQLENENKSKEPIEDLEMEQTSCENDTVQDSLQSEEHVDREPIKDLKMDVQKESNDDHDNHPSKEPATNLVVNDQPSKDDVDNNEMDNTNRAESPEAHQDPLELQNNDEVDSKEPIKDLEMDQTSSSNDNIVEDTTAQKETNEDVKSKEPATDLVVEDQPSCSKDDDDNEMDSTNQAESPEAHQDPLELQNNDEVDSNEPATDLMVDENQPSCSKDDVQNTEDFKSKEPIKDLEMDQTSSSDDNVVEDTTAQKETGDEDVKSKEPATDSLVDEDQPSCSKDDDNEMDSTNQAEPPNAHQDPLELENNDEIDSKEDIKRLLIEPDETSCSKDDTYFVSMKEVQNIIKETQRGNDVSNSKNLSTNEQETNIDATSEDPLRQVDVDEVFPVIEIVEDENPEVVEVIDVDESTPTQRRVPKPKILNRSVFKNRFTGGTCIEILSDEDEAPAQEVQVEQSTIIQQSSKYDAADFQKNQLEDILQEVKMLTSTEYLLFYLKLPPKWEQDKNSTLNPMDTIRKKLDNQEIIIPEKNTQILKAIDASVKETSRNTVQNIVDRVIDLTVKEYLWLRCYLPTHCVNPSLQHCLLPHGSATASQTVLWLKSHLEEQACSMMLKQEVFNNYETYCTKNNIQVMSSSRFGKLINQVFPNIGRKRMRNKGSSAYYYVGLQNRCRLDPPRLPKLQQKSGPGEIVDIKCEIEYTNNKKEKKPSLLNGVKNPHRRKQKIVENDTDSLYRSNQLDGQTILIHDPLALLDISTNDSKALNDTTFHQTASVKNHKYTRTSSQMHNHSGGKYKSVINNVRKVKYKEYKHPSVQKVFKKFNTIVLPTEVFRININPSVSLDNTEMNNYYGEQIGKYIQTLSKMVIRKPSRNPNFNVSFSCCNDVFEINDSYAKQLTDLKTNLSNVVVEKSENDYKVIQTSAYNPENHQTFRITKELTNFNARIKSNKVDGNIKHVSVQKLSEKFKNVVLPEEIFQFDVDPVIVLNSGEVIEWYIKKLDNLKNLKNLKNVKNLKDTSSDSGRVSPPQRSRHSKAKMMNFCEIDSSDEEDNRPVAEYKFIPFVHKHEIDAPVLGNTPLPESQTNETLIESVSETNTTIENETVQERPNTGQKRLNDEEANEIEQKRKKFYCSKITISPNYKERCAEEQECQGYVCPFCASVFQKKNSLVNHRKEHLFCKSCKRKLRNTSVMMEHLTKHCSLNRIKNKPRVKLYRIDSIPSMLEKYARAFREPVLNFTNVTLDLPKNFSAANVKRTYSKAQPFVRILNPTLTESPQNQTDLVYNPKPQEPMFHLKNTISNNLNKILLLSTNNTQTQSPTNFLYGTLYVNNTNGPASPLTLNTSLYNPTTSASNIDCAMNSNPSCSNDLQQPPTFMQIVESPNTSVMQYTTPVSQNLLYEQHQDHSYHQQQLFQVGGNIPTMNNIVFVSNNVPALSELQSTAVNTSSETETGNYLINNTETNNSGNNPPQGQFKIRVKSIQELR